VEFVPLSAHWLDQVADLEARAGDVGWSRQQFEKELALVFSTFTVIAQGETCVGYGGFWGVAGEAQVTNLVIEPSRRRQGLGRRLLESLIEAARGKGLRRMTLELRSTNAAALRLYETLGFQTVGQRSNVYQSPDDHALMMEKIL
jgi:[ribosomal protein S18]-alanine N-acetyltransferase